MNEAILSWVDDRLADLAGPAADGPVRVGPVLESRVRPWGTVLRLPVASWFPRSPGSRGDWVWFKSSAPATRYEATVTSVVAQRHAPAVVAPLAVDPDRGWLLLPDGGAPIAEAADDPAGALAAAILEYGRLQRAVTPDSCALVAAGVPDLRPSNLRRSFGDALLAARRAVIDAATACGDPDRKDLVLLRGQLAQINRRREELLAPVRVLERSALRPSVDHNDLHPGNVLLGGGSPRFYDWGDASIAHPFAAVQLPLGYLRHVSRDEKLFTETRDAYLEGFAGSACGEDLRATLDAAVRLAPISRTLSWDRALRLSRELGEPIDSEQLLAPARTFVKLLDPEPYHWPWA
ncbi:hypothetical protein FDO65_18365 [Nakamurella flava]|uniref:Aminoglycoside phosphotransferase domain-containing protein n=1 Tax=Nakamurella flava TaxID=2576308 RepID=A0A4U6QA71_9ACTN|nr:phosphotransferase [Nakamurella flava]TKV56811.1 hypothetical protein FDO65_18365 [Nakamurella flava]